MPRIFGKIYTYNAGDKVKVTCKPDPIMPGDWDGTHRVGEISKDYIGPNGLVGVILVGIEYDFFARNLKKI